MGYNYKPGDFGDIKDLVRKANEKSNQPWSIRANAIESKTTNEGKSVETDSSNKKPAKSTMSTKNKRRGNSKAGSAKSTATESKKTKAPSTKQKPENPKPKAKVLSSDSSANKDKAENTLTPTADDLETLWDAARVSKTKKLKEDDQTQVWLDSELHRKIEMLNLKCGKPAPTKHVINAILTLFLDAHKSEIAKAKNSR